MNTNKIPIQIIKDSSKIINSFNLNYNFYGNNKYDSSSIIRIIYYRIKNHLVIKIMVNLKLKIKIFHQ